MFSYLNSLKNEISIISGMKEHFSKRNLMFKNEVSELLRKYENT